MVSLVMRPVSKSTDTWSPSEMPALAAGHSRMGRPMLMELRKKMRAKLAAITQLTPLALMAMGACSREEPQPKLTPATITSPGFTL